MPEIVEVDLGQAGGLSLPLPDVMDVPAPRRGALLPYEDVGGWACVDVAA